MNTNDVFDKYSTSGVSIRIDTIDSDDSSANNVVLIECNSAGLQMLSELFNAIAQDKGRCGIQISPSGAGKIYFSPLSRLGLYVHCTDWCHVHTVTPSGFKDSEK